jgi:hypothetical protein
MPRDLKGMLLLACLAQPLHAQAITYGGCVDDRGFAVASISDNSVQDIAVAMRAPNGAPIIRYNPQVVAWTKPQTRLFFYGHECAHHALGQVTQMPSKANEQVADCWSARELTQRQLLSDADITVVQGDIKSLGKDDWSHISGPQRAINLRGCLPPPSTLPTTGGGSNVVLDPVERKQVWQDAYDECMEARVDRCMGSCQDSYGHSYVECSQSFCRIEAPANANVWEPACKKKAMKAVKDWEAEQKAERNGD